MSSEKSPDEKPDDGLGKFYTVSRAFPDGTLAEMVYSKEAHRANFAVARGGKIEIVPELLLDKDGKVTAEKTRAVSKLLPSYQICSLISKNFIYAPSGIEEYGTAQQLYDEIRAYIQKYVVLEDERFYDVAAGYVLMTWVFDRFSTVPYLRVIGELGTGKSRFLEVVGKVCNRVMMASGSITMAAVFRTLDVVQGTLVFDEADFRSSDMTDDIVKLLNGGHKKDAPVVRMEIVDDQYKTASFRVFGPKVLGSRHPFADTALESRCVAHRMFPKEDIKVPVLLPRSFDAETQTLRNKLLMYRLRNFHQISDDESAVGGLRFPRLKQTALALASVVKTVSNENHKSVIEYLADYQTDILNAVSTDIYADIILCIAWIMETDGDVKKSGELSMNRIAYEFNNAFYEDYASRETRHLNTKDGPLDVPGQRVSPRKIGTYVDKLGLMKERNSKGIFIPIHRERRKIDLLVNRYSLAKVIEEKKANRKHTPRTTAVKDSPKEIPKDGVDPDFIPDEAITY